MSLGDDTYFCPVCDKPFDRDDRLFDFAVAAHEKNHRPGNNSPANMIRYDNDSLMWVCNLCGHPLHVGEYSAQQAAIGHCRTAHGALTGGSSSAPVTARGGRGSGSRTIGDIAGDIGETIGDFLGSIFRGLGGD